jgi:hypothetical protein
MSTNKFSHVDGLATIIVLIKLRNTDDGRTVRRKFEKDQDIYIATKYQPTKCFLITKRTKSILTWRHSSDLIFVK